MADSSIAHTGMESWNEISMPNASMTDNTNHQMDTNADGPPRNTTPDSLRNARCAREHDNQDDSARNSYNTASGKTIAVDMEWMILLEELQDITKSLRAMVVHNGSPASRSGKNIVPEEVINRIRHIVGKETWEEAEKRNRVG